MGWYAHTPVRAGRQVAVDLLVVAWVAGAVRVGHVVHTTLARRVGDPVSAIAGQADGIAGQLHRAADTAGRLPLVGNDLKSPVNGAAGSSEQIAATSRNTVATIESLAATLGVVITVALSVAVVLVWLVVRLRFTRSSAAVANLRARSGGADLLALRALATASPRRLRALGPDPVARWRAGDPATIRALAAVSLASVGARPGPIAERPAGPDPARRPDPGERPSPGERPYPAGRTDRGGPPQGRRPGPQDRREPRPRSAAGGPGVSREPQRPGHDPVRPVRPPAQPWSPPGARPPGGGRPQPPAEPD